MGRLSDLLAKALLELRSSLDSLMRAVGRLAAETQTCVVDVHDVQALLTSQSTRIADLESRLEVLEAIVLKARGDA